ncbi:MAG TPA: hypothetical protein VGV07_12770 [Devosia sp.]|jgi:hypothetical protein|uniref:hypothetical protein n=1 Tax=Devosia sp. TaxID=1871048 RepID=UPI002DDD907C|nr:hypothetical protein [Devosia sp.]HEV2516118.1 hypothetical protein [Devosia sp.]
MEILRMLHDSEINGSVEWFFDGVWTVKIGDPVNGVRAKGVVASADEAEVWLHVTARVLYPDGDYAKATEPQ